MNVIFLKHVPATPLGVPRTNSDQMELLARMQKAIASWGDVPPGTTSAPNCLIMVRQLQWVLIMLIATIPLLLLYTGGKMGNNAMCGIFKRYYLAPLHILSLILIDITSNIN